MGLPPLTIRFYRKEQQLLPIDTSSALLIHKQKIAEAEWARRHHSRRYSSSSNLMLVAAIWLRKHVISRLSTAPLGSKSRILDSGKGEITGSYEHFTRVRGAYPNVEVKAIVINRD